MKTSTLVLIFSLVSVCFAQQLISLSTIKGGGEQTPLQLPIPFGIYLSACTDSNALLGQIFVVTGDNEQVSLNQLKNSNSSGEMRLHRITNSAYLTTNLTADQLNTLHGVMFLSTPKQLQDHSFHVYDVSAFKNIIRILNSTILFLNTCIDAIPKKSTIIKNWYQNSDTVAHIYAGIPTDSIEPKNTEIFLNPMHTDNFDAHFQNVEKFSLSMVAFYLKTYNGPVSFYIQSDYDKVITINTKRDTTYFGFTAPNIIGNLPAGKTVTVGQNDGASHSEFSETPNDFIAPWITPNIGQKIQVSSNTGNSVVYYTQDFVFQGTVDVGTTKSSAGKLQATITLMISTVVVGFL